MFKGTLSGLRQFLAAKIPLKMIKNAFYFTSKAIFVLNIFTFLSWLFGHAAKWLDTKDKVNFEFYGIIAWLTNSLVNIQILPNISRSKGNQTIKSGQLINVTWETFFLKNHTQNVVEKLVLLKLGISMDQQFKVL